MDKTPANVTTSFNSSRDHHMEENKNVQDIRYQSSRRMFSTQNPIGGQDPSHSSENSDIEESSDTNTISKFSHSNF